MTQDHASKTETVHQDNVDRILDAAERLFRHYGYYKTNVADIARDLGMSPANIYRFFKSKAEIHEALAERLLSAGERIARDIAALPASAGERLRQFVMSQHQFTVETMFDEEKIHEMVVVAMENQWAVIEKHIDREREIVAEIIQDGINAGEFLEQDAMVAAKCFCSAMACLVHPQMVAQCPPNNNRATPEQLVNFMLRALRV